MFSSAELKFNSFEYKFSTAEHTFKSFEHNFHPYKKLFLLAEDHSSTSRKSFFLSGIRQLIISPTHDENENAGEHHQEILRLGDSISQMGKGT